MIVICFRTYSCFQWPVSLTVVVFFRTIVGTMDALVRLHETHTGGAESAVSTVLTPSNTTTVVPNIPMLNASHRMPVETWVTANPVYKPVISVKSNVLPTQSQDVPQKTGGKVDTNTPLPKVESTSHSILESTVKYSTVTADKLLHTPTPSILEEVMVLPDRSQNDKKSKPFRNRGH